MPPTGFEPSIPASERVQIYALGRAATGIGTLLKRITYGGTKALTQVWEVKFNKR
jgi:hypothetical protein